MKITIGILIAVVIALVVGCATPHKTEPYEVSFHAYVQRWVTSPYGFHQINPVGDVMIKNTDSVPRTFKVEITHYYGDKSYTKDFILQLEPGQIKTATMDYQSDVHDSVELAKKVSAGDWGIDYQVTPDN